MPVNRPISSTKRDRQVLRRPNLLCARVLLPMIEDDGQGLQVIRPPAVHETGANLVIEVKLFVQIATAHGYVRTQAMLKSTTPLYKKLFCNNVKTLRARQLFQWVG